MYTSRHVYVRTKKDKHSCVIHEDVSSQQNVVVNHWYQQNFKSLICKSFYFIRRMAERRDDRDLRGAGGLNNPLLDDLLLSAAAAAASGSTQSNLGNMPGPSPQQQQQQQQQYQSWSSSFDHMNMPSAYSGWYGQPGMTFGSGADLLSGAFPHYDDLLAATVNQGTSNEDPLLSKPASFEPETQPSVSVPSSMSMSSGAFLASHPEMEMGMGFSPPDHTPGIGGNSFQLGEPPSGAHGPLAGDSGSAFQQAAADGRNMYTDALNAWELYQGSIFSPFRTDVFQEPEPKPVDPAPWENQNHQTPTITSHSEFIKSPPPPIPTPRDTERLESEHSMPEVTAQSVQNLADQILEGITTTSTSSESVSTPSPQQPSTVNPSTFNSRPSYSDVAKHAKTSSNVPKQQQKSSSEWLASENLPPEFPSVPVILKPPQRQKPKSSRHSQKTKSDSESSLKPDSKYGLDMFEDMGRKRGRTHNSECSTPQSRKSSASSITSASSGCTDDVRHVGQGDVSGQSKQHSPLDSRPHSKVNAYDTADVAGVVGSKYDIRKGDLTNHHKFSQGTQAHMQENRAGSASPHTSTQPKHKRPNTESIKSNQTQPKVFFDPKRIFQTQSSSKSSAKQSGTEKSTIPNNQQPSAASWREHPDVLLNNGKPTSSLFSGGNVGKPSNTTYINNDLRHHKKQTNTEERNSPHRSTTDDHRRVGARHRHDHVTSDVHTSHQGASRSSSAGRKKKPETVSGAFKKQTTGLEDRPKRSRKQKDEGPNPLTILCEYLILTL